MRSNLPEFKRFGWPKLDRAGRARPANRRNVLHVGNLHACRAWPDLPCAFMPPIGRASRSETYRNTESCFRFPGRPVDNRRMGGFDALTRAVPWIRAPIEWATRGCRAEQDGCGVQERVACQNVAHNVVVCIHEMHELGIDLWFKRKAIRKTRFVRFPNAELTRDMLALNQRFLVIFLAERTVDQV